MDRTKETLPNGTILRIRNLSINVNENHLREIFGCFGMVDAVAIEFHNGTKVPTSVATVTMHSVEDRDAAFKGMNKGQIDGKQITLECVAESSKKEEKPATSHKRLLKPLLRRRSVHQSARSPLETRIATFFQTLVEPQLQPISELQSLAKLQLQPLAELQPQSFGELQPLQL
ncbi:hypothetical protein BLSTO_01248 [Blastocystis sp. subtype 1]